jgi:hypothetical protein
MSIQATNLLTIGEASRILVLSPETVRTLERRGKLRPTLRTSTGMRIYDRVEVEQLAAERARQRGTSAEAPGPQPARGLEPVERTGSEERR